MYKLLFAGIVFISINLFAIDKEEIITNFKNEITNNDSVEVTSMKAVGKLSGNNAPPIPLRIFFRKDKMYRMELVIRGITKKNVIRDNDAWLKYMGPPTKLNFADSLETIRLASIIDVLMINILRDTLDYKYTGTEEVDGKTAYVIETTNLIEEVNKFYFDKDNFRLIKREEFTYTQGYPAKTEIYLKDYERINGYLVPTKAEIVINNSKSVFDFTQIVPNYRLERKVFRMPQ